MAAEVAGASARAEAPDCAQVVLVTLPGTDVPGILHEVQRQTDQLPRGSTVQAALMNSSVVQTSSREEAAHISNRCLSVQLASSAQLRLSLLAVATA